MNGDGSATVTVSIEATTAGKPNGTVLATASATPPITAAWVHFSFSTPPSVTSGTMYAIVFNTGRNTNVCIAAIHAGAEGWAWDGAWYPYGDPPEFAFQTYVDAAAATPSPAPTAEPTATPSPSSSATPPPTGTGVGPASDDPGSTIWFLAVALVAFFGGLLVLVTRQRRRIW